MEKIFILGNNNTLLSPLGYKLIDIPNLTDEEIHDWIISLFKNNDIEKLIIEIDNRRELSLKIALHIRLSIKDLKAKSLVPILFISHSTLYTIILNTTVWSHLLATKGIFFLHFNNLENIRAEISAIKGITTNEYKTGFLNIIKILPDERIGRHSLANIWGAYTMDVVASTGALLDDETFRKDKTKLYFKYVSAQNDISELNSSLKIVGQISIGDANIIPATTKKILLIDDEANKGWETVLRKVFKTSSSEDFVVINEKIKDYDCLSLENQNLIENTPFDLYLIDLRLNGTEEEKTLRPTEFSGMKILQKIKSFNQGYQVIIFTASNKVWNLKALLDAGADGYYMKESPEFGFSTEFSKQNYLQFQRDVKQCFERKYLQAIWSNYIAIKTLFQEKSPLTKYFLEDQEQALNYQNLIITELESIFDILKTPNENRFNSSMILLLKILEYVTEIVMPKKDSDKDIELKFWDGEIVDFWEYDEKMNKYNRKKMNKYNRDQTQDKDIKDFSKYKSIEHKIHALLFQKLFLNEPKMHNTIHSLVSCRNHYIHPPTQKKTEEKQTRFKQEKIKPEEIEKWNHCIRKILENI